MHLQWMANPPLSFQPMANIGNIHKMWRFKSVHGGHGKPIKMLILVVMGTTKNDKNWYQ